LLEVLRLLEEHLSWAPAAVLFFLLSHEREHLVAALETTDDRFRFIDELTATVAELVALRALGFEQLLQLATAIDQALDELDRNPTQDKATAERRDILLALGEGIAFGLQEDSSLRDVIREVAARYRHLDAEAAEAWSRSLGDRLL